MNNFIKVPNLPEKNVTSVIVDYRMSNYAIKKLHSLGICVYTTKRTEFLHEAISGHTDVVLHHLGEKKFLVSPENYDLLQNLNGAEIIVGKSYLGKLYPNDIPYNAARVGDFLIHNFKYTDKILLDNTLELTKISVKQGYSKCSVCIINRKAIITSDAGIYNECKKYGFDVLMVDDTNIKLKGMSHGFLGGSSGLIAPNLLAVNGNIKKHKNYREIFKFCSKYGVEILSLHQDDIEDIGSIIALTE